MNKEEYKIISVEVIEDILRDMEKEDISGMYIAIAALSMYLFASKLRGHLFDSEEIER